MKHLTLSIGECPFGIFALDENGDIIESKLFPKDSRETSGRLLLIREGKLTEEHIALINELIDEGYKSFKLESGELASQLKDRFENGNFEVEIPDPATKELRKSLRKIAEDFDFKNPSEFLRDVNILLTREELRREASERDKIVIESINTIDELDKTSNSLFGRITEWYGIHFPELERHVSDHSEYLKLISELGGRGNFTEENLSKTDISSETAEKIQLAAEESIGAEFDELDIKAIQLGTQKILTLTETRKKTTEYLEGLMEQVAPNMKTLVGGLIGARLISLAGGLDELAKMPSSTIQVLGAEKALFRALRKKNAKPPKHGIIFQHPEVRGSPRSIRGKIARALAGKLAIAAKVDAMSGRYVGDRLKEELEERIEIIKSEK